MVVFGLWQVPAARPALSKWFVCSPANPPAAAVLSSVSHAGLTHLLFNLVSLFTFGGPVRAALASVPRGWPVWPLMLGSAVSGSVFHLILGSGRNVGGCMGLSDVTMALFAVYARLYPRHSLGFLLAGVVPVRMQASRLLGFMAAWSGAGTLLSRTRAPATNIGHAAHLGGILFGLAYFEAWSRRRQWRSWIISHAIKLGRQ
jgi:membrane associated rhomboid family serine protease